MAIVVNIEDLERGLRIFDQCTGSGKFIEIDDKDMFLKSAKLLYSIMLEGALPAGSRVELN